MVELSETATPPDLREALSRALRDPLLQIGYWLPDSNRYVDLDGRAFDLPPAGALASQWSSMADSGSRYWCTTRPCWTTQA